MPPPFSLTLSTLFPGVEPSYLFFLVHSYYVLLPFGIQPNSTLFQKDTAGGNALDEGKVNFYSTESRSSAATG